MVGFDVSRPAEGPRAHSELNSSVLSTENGACWKYYTYPEYYRGDKDFKEEYDWYSGV